MRTIFAAIFKAALGWLGGWIGAYLTRRKLASETARAERAEAKGVQDEQIIKAEQSREQVETEIQKLPDAPAQALATADPATAAGRLRAGGWLRHGSPNSGRDAS